MIEVTAKLIFIISRPSLNNNYLEKSKILHKLLIEKHFIINFVYLCVCSSVNQKSIIYIKILT